MADKLSAEENARKFSGILYELLQKDYWGDIDPDFFKAISEGTTNDEIDGDEDAEALRLLIEETFRRME